MQKKLIVIVLVLLIGGFAIFPAAADSQVDITLYWPFTGGIESDLGNETFDTLKDYLFIVPFTEYNYFILDNGIKLGLGARMFTLIIESIAYPVLTAEAELSDFVLRGQVGGGAFLFFGLWNSLETEKIIMPELSAAYRLNDWFSVGAGSTFFFAPEATDLDSYIWFGHVFGRFTF